MIDVSLRDFARLGSFGPVSLGIARDDLISHLGEPDLWGGPDAKSVQTAAIWRYGDVEFYFDKQGKLHQVFSDTFTGASGTLNGGLHCNIDSWIVREFMTLESLEAGLRNEGIGYSIRPSSLPLLSDLITEARVRFTFRVGFEDELDEEYERLGLQYFVASDKWRSDAQQ